MPKKSGNIGSRIPTELRRRLDEIIGRHKTSDSIILNELLPAFCDAVERSDAIRFPIEILMSERQIRAAEGPDVYAVEAKHPGGAGAGTAPGAGGGDPLQDSERALRRRKKRGRNGDATAPATRGSGGR